MSSLSVEDRWALVPLDETIRMKVLGLDVSSPNIHDVYKDDLSILKGACIRRCIFLKDLRFILEIRDAQIISVELRFSNRKYGGCSLRNEGYLFSSRTFNFHKDNLTSLTARARSFETIQAISIRHHFEQ